MNKLFRLTMIALFALTLTAMTSMLTGCKSTDQGMERSDATHMQSEGLREDLAYGTDL